jgi:plasmid stability protein
MPDDLRTELEAAAAGHGHSLTQEMIGRLRESLARERIDRQDPAMRALCFLFQDLAERIHLRQPEFRRDFKWHHNRFYFRTFKLAVAQLLDALEPPGEIKPPGRVRFAEDDPGFYAAFKQMVDAFKTPESAATYVVTLTLESLFRPRRVTGEDEAMMRKVQQKLNKERGWTGQTEYLVEEWKREYFAMDRAGRALGVNQSPVLGKFQKKETKQ